MGDWGKLAMTGAFGLVAGAGVVWAMAGGSAATSVSVKDGQVDRSAIEAIIHDYIVNHPEVLVEAGDNMERKRTADAVADHKAEIFTPFGTAFEGAADGDVTLVQFFDYACGYCRASRPDIEKMLAKDKKLRIVYREMPILSQESLDAARVSLAVAKLGGNYSSFHKAIYESGKPTADVVNRALKVSGVDAAKAKDLANSDEIENEIAANQGLQRPLGLSGTPSWVVGSTVRVGAVPIEELEKAIADARAGK